MAKAWMLKARAEVMEKMEKIQDIDKKKYLALVENVAKQYGKQAGATGADIALMVNDLKKAWNHVQAAHKGAPRKGKAKKAKR